MAEKRLYPMVCRPLYCGEVSCPATCPNLPELQAFKAWRERTGAVMADEAEQRKQQGPSIGRKRRARRARGRRIETGRNAAAHGSMCTPCVSAFYIVPTEQDARAFFNPSLGEP